MFKTIKSKLIGGFSLITILIVLVAIFSVVKINESSDGFKSYREMARASLMSSRIQANMLMVRMNVKDYLFNPVQKEVDEFQSYYDKTSTFIKEAEELINDPERSSLLEKMSSGLVEYKLNFEKVQAFMKQRNELVDNGLDLIGPQMEKTLTTVMREEVELGDLDIANKSAESIRTLLLARLYAAKFIKDNEQATMDRVLQEFDNLNSQLWTLKSQVSSEKHTDDLQVVSDEIATYKNKIETLYKVINDRNDIVDNKLNVIGPQIAELSEDIKLSLKAEQDRIGPEVQQNNENIVMAMILSSAIVALIAILIAFFLPRSIARGLASIQQALNNISSSGDFGIRADDSREDEVGDMGRAVNSLLIDMQKAINESTEVIQAIAKGDFSKRIQADLHGDLDSLKQGINGSADSIDDTMTQLSHVMAAMSKGDFNVTINAAVEGKFLEMVESSCLTLKTLNDTISDIINIMTRMENGDFEHRVTVEAHGDLLKLKSGVNNSMDAIESAMADIIRIVVAQSKGDLTQSISADYNGQLDTLKQAINSSAARLADVVGKALEATNIVSNAADEVSRGALDLSQRVQEQAAALEETSATMDEMNSAVQGNTDNAQEASAVAQDVQSKANTGVTVMNQTIEAMDAIQESSHKINDIVSLIDGIAFQTNLLALNAAVEAARAGEHGRGFAVVASEVRALAQKSAEAAKEIKTLIEESVNRIDDGTQLASESGKMLSEINASIDTVSQMIKHIAEASGEQATGVSQVHQAISQIDEVTQQNAALVEETSAASASMNDQSSLLRQEMSFFHIGGASKAIASAPIAKEPAAKLEKPVGMTAKTPAPSKPMEHKQETQKPEASDIKSYQKKPLGSNEEEWQDF